jgi:hypothetical protein
MEQTFMTGGAGIEPCPSRVKRRLKLVVDCGALHIGHKHMIFICLPLSTAGFDCSDLYFSVAVIFLWQL